MKALLPKRPLAKLPDPSNSALPAEVARAGLEERGVECAGRFDR
ncbi:MAG: hypothetical protein AVDCRST_MAG03-3468 [uncultured Rubrobacteraceae bacterium]|uniref:Uncharacterized protein n=1 Tax=uncultured Rubrobacteraceae bacterium TaxID=349277 RepID=A0A6J4Q5L4_9ACTN|nr:MAG: hypothetical protein AVDCRST_MAG03-3468 [uncultured Rubrobacteraceae bacterium]